MEGLTAFRCVCGGRFPLRSPPTSLRQRPSRRRSSQFRVLAAASREGPELDRWDLMELKFGKLLGEDPKLTLAKIMAKKANPDVSYLDVEKSFYKNKGKLDDNMLNIPINMNVERQPSALPREKILKLSRPAMHKGGKATSDLNLSRPAMNKGGKATPDLNLSRPAMSKGVKPADDLNLSLPMLNKGVKSTDDLNLSRSVINNGVNSTANLNLSRPILNNGVKIARPDAQNQLPHDIDKKSLTPNVALRKPDVAQEDDIETDKRSKLKLKPNLFLKMRKDTDENLSAVPLLKKPEVVQKPLNSDMENKSSGGCIQSSSSEILRDKLEMIGAIDSADDLDKNTLDKWEDNVMVNIVNDSPKGSPDNSSDSIVKSSKLDTGLQPSVQRDVASNDIKASSIPLDEKSANYSNDVFQQASLLGRPRRLDSSARETLWLTEKAIASLKKEDSDNDEENMISAEQEEREGNDWKRAEDLFHTGERAEVELVSCSSKGFIVSFGSLVGFLPYRNLGAKWKFLAFESWLRKKGLDPSQYRQNLSIIGSYDAPNKNLLVESDKSQKMGEMDEETLAPSMQFEELLKAYDKEKRKFLSSFIGQIIKVTVLLADRNSRRLIFSGRPKEKEELIEKKRTVMAKLSVGDVVKCCIKKITYFGIFVEVEGVSALIHQSEISWDASMDPSSYYKLGQIVEAKVYQLDYALERITLSLKEIMPDPLMEALESVVGDHTSLEGGLEAAQADIEPWADVELLLEELQQMEGVQNVSKGRFFLSPGLAPTFQVYMASVLDNQYKLLARSGNKVQEVIVQASLDKEQMKAAILTCTNRVQ